jgi:CheY-like chemotaxis protein
MESPKIPDIVKGKRVLIVDDEKDVLDTLTELLDMCKLDAASSFEQGKEFLENEYYDVAVLDIMGVKGYELLEIANSRDIPALMLTAHALSEEKKKNGWVKWFDRLGNFFDKRFGGTDWREKEKDFWEKKVKGY